MIYATDSKRADFKYHTKYGYFKLILNADGTVGDPKSATGEAGKEAEEDKGPRIRIDDMERHGKFMFIAWGVGGFIMFCAKRYFKTYWFVTNIIHVVIGWAILLITFLALYSMIKLYGVKSSFHPC